MLGDISNSVSALSNHATEHSQLKITKTVWQNYLIITYLNFFLIIMCLSQYKLLPNDGLPQVKYFECPTNSEIASPHAWQGPLQCWHLKPSGIVTLGNTQLTTMAAMGSHVILSSTGAGILYLQSSPTATEIVPFVKLSVKMTEDKS